MVVSELNAGLTSPYKYSIQFEYADVHTMYDIADWVESRNLGYWVGCITRVVHVGNLRDVTWVQLHWADQPRRD